MKNKNSVITKLPEQIEEVVETDKNITKENKDLLAFIKKGGKSARPKSQKSKIEEKSICLRMSIDIAERVNFAVSERVPKVSKNSWILEAVLEKLSKENY